MMLAASSKKYIVVVFALCRALLSVIFSHFSKNSPAEPPPLQKLLDASALSFKGDLDWNKGAADGKRAGHHTGGVAVMGVME